MSDWINIKLVRQYQKERLQEATQLQLIREAPTSQLTNPAKPIYAPTLARIGGWLITWGSRLQAHYGNLAENIAVNLSVDPDCDNATAI